MAMATVYTINKDRIVVDQFDVEFDFAVAHYFGTANSKGTYYIAKKGIKIPFKFKNRILKNIMPSHE